MKNHWNTVLVLLMFIMAVQCQINYCSFPNCNHTLCIYPTAGPSAQCTNPQGNGLTAAEEVRILNAHNAFRQKVASGLETRGNPGPQPAATNMVNLIWNDEIATIAQRWAEQCRFQSDLCRRTSTYPYANQNLAARGTTGSVSTIQVESLVQLWTDTVIYFDKTTVGSFVWNSQAATYSQVVWALTTQLGCGATKYFDGIYNRFYLVCNYAPGGNVIGQPVTKHNQFHHLDTLVCTCNQIILS